MLNGINCKAQCSLMQVMQKSCRNQDESGLKNKCEQKNISKAKLVHNQPYSDIILDPINFYRYYLTSSLFIFIQLSEVKKRVNQGFCQRQILQEKKSADPVHCEVKPIIFVCKLFLQTGRIWGKRVLGLGLFCVGFVLPLAFLASHNSAHLCRLKG